MKKFLSMTLALIMTLSLVACGGGSGGEADADVTYELKFASQNAEGLPSTEAMYWIADQVSERTGGKVAMKISYLIS